MINNKYIFIIWTIILIFIFVYAYYSSYYSLNNNLSKTNNKYQNQLDGINKQDSLDIINQQRPYFQAYDRIEPIVNNYSRETTTSNIKSVIDGI